VQVLEVFDKGVSMLLNLFSKQNDKSCYNKILELVKLPILIIDNSGKVVFSNTLSEGMFGAKAVGQPFCKFVSEYNQTLNVQKIYLAGKAFVVHTNEIYENAHMVCFMSVQSNVADECHSRPTVGLIFIDTTTKF